MNSKLTDEQLIAYLYGELSAEEVNEIEKYLEENPEEKAKLDSLNQTRMLMNELDDEEMPEPLILSQPSQNIGGLAYWRPYLGVAATLLLVMTFAWLTNFGISNDENGFRIGYQEVQSGLSSDQVAALIEKDRKATMEQMRNMMSAGQDSLYREIQTVEASISEQPQLMYQQEKQALMDDMIELSDDLSSNYRELMRELIVNFSNNYQSQRIQDLQNIQAAFNDLEDATVNNQLNIEDELIRLSDRLDAVIANLNNNK